MENLKLPMDTLKKKVEDLNVFELHAANSLMKSFLRSKDETHQKVRSVLALEELLGPIDAPLYAILPAMLEEQWSAATEAMMQLHPEMREKYKHLVGE